MAYNTTYFKNNPDVAESPGLLYIIILVNKKTFERECLKIGITKGTSFKDANKRAAGFKGYDIRIQKLLKGTLEEVYNVEQMLHAEFAEQRFHPKHKFGGHTECFETSILKEVLEIVKE